MHFGKPSPLKSGARPAANAIARATVLAASMTLAAGTTAFRLATLAVAAAPVAMLQVATPTPALAEVPGVGQRTLCVHGVADDASLPVHARPSGRSRVIARLQPGACGVRLAGRCRGEWCDMALGDVRGWVSSRYVGVYELGGSESVAAAQTPRASGGSEPGTDERLSSAPAAGVRGEPAAAARPSIGTMPSATIASIQPAPTEPAASPMDRREADERRIAAAPIARPAPEGRTSERRAGRAVRSRPVVARSVVRSARAASVRGAGSEWIGACVVGVESWDTLRIRRGPGVEHRSVGGIPAGACRVAPAGGCYGPWCRVAWRGRVGWVNAIYLR